MGFFFSSRRRHTRYWRDWSSDVCSSDLELTRAVSAVATFSHVHHPLTREEENPRRAAGLIATSDRGLAGAYSSNVLREGIGRESCGEREQISAVAGSLKKTHTHYSHLDS